MDVHIGRGVVMATRAGSVVLGRYMRCLAVAGNGLVDAPVTGYGNCLVVHGYIGRVRVLSRAGATGRAIGICCRATFRCFWVETVIAGALAVHFNDWLG